MPSKYLDSRLRSVDASRRETMYIVLSPGADGSPNPVDVVRITGNPARISVCLKPYDLTYDRFVLRLFVRQHETNDVEPTVLVDGIIYEHESTGGIHFRGNPHIWRMLTINIPLDKRAAAELIDRPVDVQVEFPPEFPFQVLISNRLSDHQYTSGFRRSTQVNLRRVIYVSQFMFLFLAGLLILLLTDYNFLDFPVTATAPVVPTLLFLFGDYINRDRLRIISTRYMYRLQLEYRSVFAVFVVASMAIAIVFADRIRCEWVKYRYQSVFQELKYAITRRDDPAAKLAELVNIAPERRENLLLFQYILWTYRHDDDIAKDRIPVRFARPVIASALQKGLDEDIRTALKRGEAPGCGCVEAVSTDDARLLWIVSLEESLGTITKQNLDVYEGIIDYLKKIVGENSRHVNPEFGVLLHRYEIVYYSHIPKLDNVEYRDAMQALRNYVDVQHAVWPSILEIAVDQLAESHFMGYCDIQEGLRQYKRLFAIRHYNLGSEILREFPPRKLTAFRIIKLLQGEKDYFNENLKDSLQQKCGPDDETLESLFKSEFLAHDPPGGIAPNEWIRRTPADSAFLTELSDQIQQGWEK